MGRDGYMAGLNNENSYMCFYGKDREVGDAPPYRFGNGDKMINEVRFHGETGEAFTCEQKEICLSQGERKTREL